MPPRARSTKATPPADLDGKTPANATSALDQLQAEVAAEPDGARDGTIPVKLGNTKVRVKDFMKWPSSANEDIGYGRYTTWARKALVAEDFVNVWAPMDPPNEEVIQFLVRWSEASGLPLGSMLTSLTS